MKTGDPELKAIEKFCTSESSWWVPRLGPQTMAYFHPADEIYYGGRAGGGKTDLLIGVASLEHTRSLIIRRIYPQLEGIRWRCNQILNHVGRFNSIANQWKINREGKKRIIQFGACQYDQDKVNYQGRPFDFMGFDEITQFLYSQFIYIKGWNRTIDPDQRCRIICTGNPPTDAEGAWIIDYWAPWLDRTHPNPAKAGEIRWFIMHGEQSIEVDGPEPVKVDWSPDLQEPHSRTFIPAEMLPELIATGYKQKLQSLPEPLRSQLLYGDHTLYQQDDEWQIIPTEWILLAMERWRNMSIPQVVNEEGKVVDAPMDFLGVDIARGGRDWTILAPRHGNYISKLIKYPGKQTPDGSHVARIIAKNIEKGTQVNLDIVGVGSSPYDYCVDMGIPTNAIDSGSGSRAVDRKTGLLRFRNLRAEMWWNLRELLDPDENNEICLPNDKVLLRELVSPRWKATPSGIVVESKEEIKKRIGRSTDNADSVVYAFYEGVRVGMVEV